MKLKNFFLFFLPPQNECFRGYTGISLSAHRCVCVSVCVQNTNFCQSAGGGIKSHLMTALVGFFGGEGGGENAGY